MKAYLLSFSILISSLFAFTQEKTYGGSEEVLSERKGGLGRMAIIPYEDRMYMSDADAPIGRETGLKPGELLEKFRNSLLESLEKEMQKDWALINVGDSLYQEKNKGLEFIHASLTYKYTAVSEEVLMENDTTLKKKELKKKKKKSSNESGLKEGQIVTYGEHQEKYMAMHIKNDTLLSFMNNRLNSNYYLFLNEFDIRHFITNPDKIADGGLHYRLKVHFTCINEKGNELISGMVTTLVPSNSQNIYKIIQQGIPELSTKLSKMIRKKVYSN